MSAAKTAMQSGYEKVGMWKLEFEVDPAFKTQRRQYPIGC
jgi:hypothetical protein